MTKVEFLELIKDYGNLSWWDKYRMLWCIRAGRVFYMLQHRQWRELLVWCFYELWSYDKQAHLEQRWQRFCRRFI